MKLILKFPIVATLLFIISFELIFQYHMMLILYITLIYVALKTTGFTKIIKSFSYISYNRFIEWITSKPKQLDIIFKNEYGNIEGKFHFKRNRKTYLIEAIRNTKRKEVTIRLHQLDSTDNPVVFLKAKDFYIKRKTVIKYLEEHHFNLSNN